MASHLPKDVNGFVGQREQARGPAGMRPQSNPYGSPLPPPSQDLEFPASIDLASRRLNAKKNRREIGDKLRVVRPSTLLNPDELPFRKRSVATLIEKAQQATQAPAEDIVALARQVSSFESFPKAPRATFDDTESIMTTDTNYFAGDKSCNQYALATDYNKRDPASNPNLKLVSIDHANNMRGQITYEAEDEDHIAGDQARVRESTSLGLEPEWKRLVDEERELFYAEHQRESTGLVTGHNDYTGATGPVAGYDDYAGATQYERSADAESDSYSNNIEDVDDHGIRSGSPHDLVVDPAGGAHKFSRSAFSVGQPNHILSVGVAPVRAQDPLTNGHVGNTGAAGKVPVWNTEKQNGDRTNPRAMPLPTKSATATKDINKGEVPVWNTEEKIGERTDHKAVTMPTKPATATKDVDKGKQVVRKTNFTIPTRSADLSATHLETKATSYGSSSPSPTFEHEFKVPRDASSAAHKRSLENPLDYTRKQLADMSYDELDSKPFLDDPEDPSHEPARVLKGQEPTLESKLSEMTDMSEDQCKAMFSSMTDAENEGTGQWFVAKMQEDMEKLMIAKHKRRMIALKYEHEIKKRNALVKAKTEDMEGELEGLKSGLSNLMPTSKKDRREAVKAGKKAVKKAGGSEVA